jgi:hypothetical protein
MLATFPGRLFMIALEPAAADRTRFTTWVLTDRPPDDADTQVALERGAAFVDAGAREDRDVALAIQRGLASGANAFFEFGLFEQAIVHFHRSLTAMLGGEDRGVS